MSDDDGRMSEQQFWVAVEAARREIERRVKALTRDPELADVLTQTCVVDAWAAWKRDGAYFLRLNLCEWAVRRASWRARDHHEARGRFAPLADDHAGDGVKVPEAYAVATPPDVERHQVWELVHECLAQMPDAERALVEGHFFDGMSDQAIGDVLFGDDGRTRQARGLTIFRRRHAAMEHLKRLLVARGYDPETGLAP